MPTPSSPLRRADRVGLFAAALCALHCALLPILVVLLPTLGLGMQGWLDIDQVIVVGASLLALVTLYLGWRRHRVYRAWRWLLPALALLWFASFGPLHGHEGLELWLHTAMMVSGGAMLGFAHWLNMRLTHRSELLALLAER